MKAITFEIVSDNSRMTTGLFFRKGKPIAYAYYRPNNLNLYICYREGESELFSHTDLLGIARKSTGLDFCRTGYLVSEQRGMIERIIAKHFSTT